MKWKALRVRSSLTALNKCLIELYMLSQGWGTPVTNIVEPGTMWVFL